MKHLLRDVVFLAVVAGLAIPLAGCGEDTSKEDIGPQPTVPVDPQPIVYVDSNGYFSIVPPGGWNIQKYADDPRGKVAFLEPDNRVELRVLVKAVPPADYDEQFQNGKSLEADLGIPMHVEKVSFNDIPAIKRTAKLTQQGVKMKYLMIDVLIEGTNNNLQYSAPEGLFDEYYDTAWLSMLSYEPLGQGNATSPEEVLRHETAKWIRMTEVARVMGNTEAAREFVSIGLEGDPENSELNQLQLILEE